MCNQEGLDEEERKAGAGLKRLSSNGRRRRERMEQWREGNIFGRFPSIELTREISTTPK